MSCCSASCRFARAQRGSPMTPFGDLHSYVAIPRVTGLRLSPDGTWLAATVQQPDPDGKKYSTSIWRIPVGGDGGPPPSGPSSSPSG